MDELSKGKFDILDTTEYMKNTLVVWEELGFRFDAISTGFIVSKEQTELITEFCKEKAGSGVVIEKAEENMVNCREAGAFECPECKTRFIPTMKNYVMVAHTLTKRKLVCPNCGAHKYCKKVLTK